MGQSSHRSLAVSLSLFLTIGHSQVQTFRHPLISVSTHLSLRHRSFTIPLPPSQFHTSKISAPSPTPHILHTFRPFLIFQSSPILSTIQRLSTLSLYVATFRYSYDVCTIWCLLTFQHIGHVHLSTRCFGNCDSNNCWRTRVVIYIYR